MQYSLLLFLLISWNTNIPDLNQKVIEYVDSVIGKKVDRGECWDLAAAALDRAGAYLDRSSQKSLYIFGKKLNPKKDEIFPGDIIQIENVKIECTNGNATYTETMNHHTAIIYKVLEKSHYKIAHQNTSFSGRNIGVSELNLNYNKKGKVTFYRLFSK